MTPQPKRPFETQPQYRTSIPNSVFENQYALSNAELRLQLIVLGRPNLPLSDETWKKFTRLDPRMKELAAKGLREKGVLQITGKGKLAKYVVDTQAWESYWRTQSQQPERARTVGRAPTVKAKPGMMVHESCADKCQKLCEANAECSKAEVISISSGQQNAKPISRNPPKSEPENAKPISRNTSQPVESITTPLGNTVPIEHMEAVSKALHRSARRINSPDTKDPKAYEAAIIRETLVKITSQKVSTAHTQTKQQRDKEIKAARAILDWKEPEHEEDRKFARDKGMYPDAERIQWAKDVIAGSGA